MAARAYIGWRRPCRHPTGDRPLSPLGWATGPYRPGGRQTLFFYARDLVANLKKKITLRAYRPMGATGGYFEIFQNGYIFLKFLFFKNIKKKKALDVWTDDSNVNVVHSGKNRSIDYLSSRKVANCETRDL